eukprot:scaffold53_cov362-Prasinococcus_capsulatus_cf.AAC.18
MGPASERAPVRHGAMHCAAARGQYRVRRAVDGLAGGGPTLPRRRATRVTPGAQRARSFGPSG